MSYRTAYSPGTFCWVDLTTRDVERAQTFYGQLMGWQSQPENNEAETAQYIKFYQGAEQVAGLMALPSGAEKAGVPAHWSSYISVDDVDATVARCRALGGDVLMEPTDVLEAGRMAILTDDEGARFCVWEPRRHVGATVVNQPGTLCWNELATRQPEHAKGFYGELFGWSFKKGQGEPEYHEHRNAQGEPNGGMLTLTPEMGQVPVHWNVYFAVDDCDATMARALELGGEACMEPRDIPDAGRFVVLKDDQGALFSVIALSQAAPAPS